MNEDQPITLPVAGDGEGGDPILDPKTEKGFHDSIQRTGITEIGVPPPRPRPANSPKITKTNTY